MTSVLIIGAGHNGLVAGAILSSEGYNVTVIEKSDAVGGLCRPILESCGCILYPGPNHYGMLHQKLRDLLESNGVRLDSVRPDIQCSVLTDSNKVIFFSDDLEETKRSLNAISRTAFQEYEAFCKDAGLAIEILRNLRDDASSTKRQFSEALAKAGKHFPALFFKGSLRDTLDEYFTSELLKGCMASSMLLFNGGPDEPGTSFAIPYYGQMRTSDKPGWAHLKGGMVRIPDGFSKIIIENKGRIKKNATVKSLTRSNNTLTQCIDSENDEHLFDYLLVGCDPWSFSDLLKRSGLLTKPWKTLRSLRSKKSMSGMCLKIVYKLRSYPKIVEDKALNDRLMRGMITNSSSLDMLQNAYTSAKSYGASNQPYIELLFPSHADPAQACGKHVVASCYSMYCIYQQSVADAAKVRKKMMSAVENEVERIVPGFSKLVVEKKFFSSNDFERDYFVSMGNIDHGSLTLDRIFEKRGLPGYRPPRTNFSNVFLASSGTVPGGLVSGVPGYVAAQTVIQMRSR